MGWAPEKRNRAQYPCGSISHSVLTGKPPDLRARIKDARFACLIAGMGIYGDKLSNAPGTMKTIWLKCVMPFVDKLDLLRRPGPGPGRGTLYLVQGDIEKESQELREAWEAAEARRIKKAVFYAWTKTLFRGWA